MTRRDVSGYGRSDPGGLFARISRYDLVLAVIPLAFASSLLATSVFSVSLQEGMAFASVLGALALVDALFVNPPQSGDGAGE